LAGIAAQRFRLELRHRARTFRPGVGFAMMRRNVSVEPKTLEIR
jgi:hypothetical protein